MSKIRRLFLDIETSPNTVYSWRVGRKITLDPSNIITERQIVCICWKWEGEKEVHSVDWGPKHETLKIIRAIVLVLDEADEIVMHNGARFDLPWIKTMAMLHGIPTNPSYKVVDTCLFAKRALYLNSNKLSYLGEFLGVGAKIKTEFTLWKEVVAGNKAALARMIKYCAQDVRVLEGVYRKLAVCMPNKTHIGALVGGGKWTCPHCGGHNVIMNRHSTTAKGVAQHKMKCQGSGCNKYYTLSDSIYKEYKEARWR